MKHLLIFILALICFQTLKASNYPGYIIDNQNNRHNGYVQMFKGFDKDIFLKTELEGTKKKIKSVELKEIGLYSENIKDTVIYTKHNAAEMLFGGKLKKLDEQVWAHQIYKSDKIEGYYAPSAISDVTNTPGGSTKTINEYQTFNGYIKLPQDNFIIFIYTKYGNGPIVVGGHKTMRTMFKYAVKKACPLIEEKLDKEKYKMEEFIKMLEGYTEFCK